MVPRELITQRMQARARGRSWQILLRILERDSVFGLYASYSATLLRNPPTGVLNYSSFKIDLIKKINLKTKFIKVVFCKDDFWLIFFKIKLESYLYKTRLTRLKKKKKI